MHTDIVTISDQVEPVAAPVGSAAIMSVVRRSWQGAAQRQGHPHSEFAARTGSNGQRAAR